MRNIGKEMGYVNRSKVVKEGRGAKDRGRHSSGGNKRIKDGKKQIMKRGGSVGGAIC